LKNYHHTNFFKHTFCEFEEIKSFDFPNDSNYRSKSDSQYFYTLEGVYRKSNHWGRVANCRWILASVGNYKNQKTVVGFAKWTAFHALNQTEKIFYITVNFELKTAKLKVKEEDNTNHLFTLNTAQKRIKQVHHLFLNDKWTKYFSIESKKLKFDIISKLIHSNQTLAEIKRTYQ
jgi:hypothetical protein